MFGTKFGKNWATFIPTSGHTVGKLRSQQITVLYKNERCLDQNFDFLISYWATFIPTSGHTVGKLSSQKINVLYKNE